MQNLKLRYATDADFMSLHRLTNHTAMISNFPRLACVAIAPVDGME